MLINLSYVWYKCENNSTLYEHSTNRSTILSYNVKFEHIGSHKSYVDAKLVYSIQSNIDYDNCLFWQFRNNIKSNCLLDNSTVKLESRSSHSWNICAMVWFMENKIKVGHEFRISEILAQLICLITSKARDIVISHQNEAPFKIV